MYDYMRQYNKTNVIEGITAVKKGYYYYSYIIL